MKRYDRLFNRTYEVEDGEWVRFADVERLRKCLRDQTHQTQITAEQISGKVNDRLRSLGVVPEDMGLAGHPCEQNVGTCIRRLQCELEEAIEQRDELAAILERLKNS